MGLFFDLYQQSRITDHAAKAESLDARLSSLLHQVIGRLEQHVGVDLDKDGRVG